MESPLKSGVIGYEFARRRDGQLATFWITTQIHSFKLSAEDVPFVYNWFGIPKSA